MKAFAPSTTEVRALHFKYPYWLNKDSTIAELIGTMNVALTNSP